jgi:hypothetical protein
MDGRMPRPRGVRDAEDLEAFEKKSGEALVSFADVVKKLKRDESYRVLLMESADSGQIQ